ncbi:hypothetical protein [Streptomyces altiplanensis]
MKTLAYSGPARLLPDAGGLLAPFVALESEGSCLSRSPSSSQSSENLSYPRTHPSDVFAEAGDAARPSVVAMAAPMIAATARDRFP